MNQLFIERFETDKKLSLKEAEEMLETQSDLIRINLLNWKNYPVLPEVKFRIGHTGNSILIKFYIAENYILAHETSINGKVHKDSCLEFFISFDRVNYYNFESNCIGVVHMGYGSGRGNREYIKHELLERIEIVSSLGNKPFDEEKGQFSWEMLVQIPIECFNFESFKTFTELNATANFYKCCDDCSEPHFVTWNPVLTEEPDFHKPEFFGTVIFK